MTQQPPDEHKWEHAPAANRLGAIECGVLLLAMIFPTLATWLYFVTLEGTQGVQVVFTACKVVQFALPAVWVLGIRKQRPRLEWTTAGLTTGIGFGALVFAVAAAAYFAWFRHSPLLSDAPAAVAAKVRDLGVGTPWRFVALAVFYSLIHSLLEEYYWRWFVFGRLRSYVPTLPAVLISSAAFMSHHVILVGIYFAPNWPLVTLLSLGVGVGGAVWAWIYHRSGSLLGPWFSHLLIDAVLMLIGYDMVFRLAAQ